MSAPRPRAAGLPAAAVQPSQPPRPSLAAARTAAPAPNAAAAGCQHSPGAPQTGRYAQVAAIRVKDDPAAPTLSEVSGELHNPCRTTVCVTVRGATLHDAQGRVVAANTESAQTIIIPPRESRPFVVRPIDTSRPWTSAQLTFDDRPLSSSGPAALCL